MSLLLFLAGCVNVDVLQKDFRETERVIQAAGNLGARECTPVQRQRRRWDHGHPGSLRE